jgi:cytochrome c
VIRAAARVLAGLALVAAPLSPAGADPVRGERVFQRCYACHSVVAGEDALPGANLRCVLGRQAGTRPGFEFSPAMIEAGARGLVWSRATLDAFLTDPEGAVPGTAMGMAGLPSADDRRDVIDYLERSGPCHGGRKDHAGPVVATAPIPARGSPSVTGGVPTT